MIKKKHIYLTNELKERYSNFTAALSSWNLDQSWVIEPPPACCHLDHSLKQCYAF